MGDANPPSKQPDPAIPSPAEPQPNKEDGGSKRRDWSEKSPDRETGPRRTKSLVAPPASPSGRGGVSATPPAGSDRAESNDRGGRNNERENEGGLRDSRVININRVAKVVKGGRRFSFTALVVIGDGKGQVGLGYGKAKEVPLAIQKGTEEAKRNLFSVPLAGTTIVHTVLGQMGAGSVLMKPAAPGTGVIAGGAARAILEEAGIQDVLCKSLGSPNHINVARATIAGLQDLKRPDEIARLRGLDAEEFVPAGLLAAYKESERDKA